jgi:hypothetical protein
MAKEFDSVVPSDEGIDYSDIEAKYGRIALVCYEPASDLRVDIKLRSMTVSTTSSLWTASLSSTARNMIDW